MLWLLVLLIVIVIMILLFKYAFNELENFGYGLMKRRARKLLDKRSHDQKDISMVMVYLGKMKNDWEAEKLYTKLEELKDNLNKMPCPYCKSIIYKDVEYCPNCGKKLVTFTKEETRKYIEELQSDESGPETQ
jgi:rubrerythrin